MARSTPDSAFSHTLTDARMKPSYHLAQLNRYGARYFHKR